MSKKLPVFTLKLKVEISSENSIEHNEATYSLFRANGGALSVENISTGSKHPVKRTKKGSVGKLSTYCAKDIGFSFQINWED